MSSEHPETAMMRVLDLFSGIGGFSLGLERAGMKAVAFCEIELAASDILAQHWPGVPNLGDVTTAAFPAADIVCGGFPCQDVSRAGKRAGDSGSRSGLFWELVRAIRVVRPKFAIMENVAALLLDGMGVVVGALADCGYDAEWDCLPAYSVGSPQERDRVWIVAHPNERQREDGRSQSARRGSTEPGEGAAPGADPDANRAWKLQPGWCFRYFGGRPVHRGTGSDEWRVNWTDRLGAFCGMADGVSRRLDEAKPIGNSVLPQIPEMIGRAIMECEGQ
jgi:DNA (cytosine-5)-methyltransferase 1